MDFRQIEKGNTQLGVTQAIAEQLHRRFQEQGLSLLDVPCGAGEFLRSLRRWKPKWSLAGVELFATPVPEVSDIVTQADARKFAELFPGRKFDVVTSISGVMVFDNPTAHLQEIHKVLANDGLLFITNDNVLTIRDRLNFLFFGRFKRFKLNYDPAEGNWNLILPQGLWKLLVQNNFEFEDCLYTSIRAEDWIFLPLVAIFYPIWLLEILFGKGSMPKAVRRKLFSWRALLARHYIIVTRRK
ncbi:MAG: class I SAM-dependent methyltransferase [Bdellovibrionaceae bacterium]|nr:class I SAM-dependent methyltransferase [Pseudobdellovibrionaceae bacterium]